jgi:Fe2+ transport system protein FeoA
MGLLEGEEVEVVAIAPFGDPIDLRIHGFQLSIRKSEASTIQVSLAGETS